MLRKLVPLAWYPMYLNGKELLPGYYLAKSHQEFAAFLLENRMTHNMLVSSLQLADYWESLQRFKPLRCFLHGDICRMPGMEVRGQHYLQVAGGLGAARRLAVMNSASTIVLKQSTWINKVIEAEQTMLTNTRIISEASDLNSSIDKFHRKRTLLVKPRSPIIWMRNPSGQLLREAIKKLCQQQVADSE